MGYSYIIATTPQGSFNGTSFTNITHFLNMLKKWKQDPKVISFKKQKHTYSHLSVEVKWKDGSRRLASYSPHAGEVLPKRLILK